MSDFDLLPPLAEAVTDMGFETPTPIQARAIPLALQGRDVIGCASTGTGKTAAFLLPILQHLSANPRDGHTPRALVLSPTRELALQIDEQCFALGYHLGISATAVVGGVDMAPQERALRAGSEVIVATPGRLLDHARYEYVDLSKIDILVLDEADRMLDMGFLPDIRRIIAMLPKDRQTLLFSATMSPEIRKLAGEFMRDPVRVAVDRRKPVAGLVQRVYNVDEEDKVDLLTKLIRREKMTSTLVFVRRRVDANRLMRAVRRSGVSAEALHANRTQEDRIAALEAFRSGRAAVLVATDVASRGLDVYGISHVINFHVPRSSDDYIHRGGRTARAGAAGDVITFVSREEDQAMRQIERAIESKAPRLSGDGKTYETPAGGEKGAGNTSKPKARSSRPRRRSAKGSRHATQ